MAHGDTNLSTLSEVILIKIVRRVYRIKDKKKFILAKKKIQITLNFITKLID